MCWCPEAAAATHCWPEFQQSDMCVRQFVSVGADVPRQHACAMFGRQVFMYEIVSVR